MPEKGNKAAKVEKKKKESDAQNKSLVEQNSFVQSTGNYNNRPRLELGGLGEVIQSIRREEYASNMDIPTAIFYKVTGCKQGNPLPLALSPVTHLDPARSSGAQDGPKRAGYIPDSPHSSGLTPAKTIDYISTTAVLPSIGRPFPTLGVREVEEDTSSSTDAAIFDDYDDTEGELEAEALELGISTKGLRESDSWTYDCLVDEDGVNIQSVFEGFNTFLLQAQLSKEVRLDRVTIQGNRMFGYVVPNETNSTIWGSARSSATITELPRSPRSSASQPICSTLKEIQSRPFKPPVKNHLFTKRGDPKITTAPDGSGVKGQYMNMQIGSLKKMPANPQVSPTREIEDHDTENIPYKTIMIRMPGRTAANKAVNLQLDYTKYRHIVELDIPQEEKIMKVLKYGKMHKRYFYQCNYQTSTIELLN